MKIKNILDKLQEKWLLGTESYSGNEYREIFVNPTKEELLQLNELGIEKWGENIRFIAVYESKNIYVTSADVLHFMIKREVSEIKPDIRMFGGSGRFNKGKLEVTWWTDELNDPDKEEQLYNLCKDLVMGEYDWVKRYHLNLDLIKSRAKKEILRIGVKYEQR